LEPTDKRPQRRTGGPNRICRRRPLPQEQSPLNPPAAVRTSQRRRTELLWRQRHATGSPFHVVHRHFKRQKGLETVFRTKNVMACRVPR
jgi:hypothetical protein